MGVFFFDTETSGIFKRGQTYVDQDVPRLLEISGILDDDERNTVGSFTFLVPYSGDVPVEAERVHKISGERTRTFGVSLPTVLSATLACIKNADRVVAHNLEYDYKMLQVEFNTIGRVDVLTHAFENKGFCTMQATTNILKIPSPWGRGYKWPKLMEAYIALINPEGFDGAHGAKADASAVREIYYHLLDNNHIS